MAHNCTIEGCTNKAFYKSSGLCQACYQVLWYWLKKKTPTQIVKRRQKLRVFEARMATLQPNVALKKRKAA